MCKNSHNLKRNLHWRIFQEQKCEEKENLGHKNSLSDEHKDQIFEAKKGQKKSWLWIDKLDYLENLRLKVFFELASDICACSLNSRAKFTLLSWTLHCDLFLNSHSKNNYSQKMLSKKGIGNRDGSKIVKMDRSADIVSVKNSENNWQHLL